MSCDCALARAITYLGRAAGIDRRTVGRCTCPPRRDRSRGATLRPNHFLNYMQAPTTRCLHLQYTIIFLFAMIFHEKRLRLIPLSSDAASNGSRCNTVFYSMDSRFVSVSCSVVGGRSVEEVPRRCRGGNDATTDLRRRGFAECPDVFFVGYADGACQSVGGCMAARSFCCSRCQLSSSAARAKRRRRSSFGISCQ